MPSTTRKKSRVGKSKSAAFVLGRWAQDHRKIRASLARLDDEFGNGGHANDVDARGDRRRIAVLVDQFIDAPDDYHHILERKAWRRAWFRSGRYLPAALDIHDCHLKMRDARKRFICEFENGSQPNMPALKLALADYADCARKAISTDEKALFPVLRRHLTRDDWREFADELRAYENVAGELAARRADMPVDSHQ